MVYRSYKDWRSAGFTVVKGEKSCARTNTGEALFSEGQVTKLCATTVRQTSYSGGITVCPEGFKGYYYNEEYINAMY